MTKARAADAGAPPGAPEVDTRRRLLEAAAACIGELGWGQVRTREIARRAGVRVALVHYHFGSKDGLMVAAARHTLRAALGESERALARASTVAEALEAIVGLVASLDPHSQDARALTEITLAASRDPRLQELSRAMLDRFRVELERVVGLSQRAGRIRDDQDAGATAAVIAALLDGLLLHRLVDPDLDLDRVRSALADGMCLTGRPPSHSPVRQAAGPATSEESRTT